MPGKLPYYSISLPNAVTPQPLEQSYYVANFGKVGFFLVQHRLVEQQGQPWDGQAW